MERTAMNTRDLQRWTVMRRIRDGTLSRREAATVLALSYRQIKRIFRRFRKRGQQGVVHGNVGRRSNRAHAPSIRARAVALIIAHFSGSARGVGQRFGPTLAAEHLATEFDLVIPVPTLRRWMLEEKLWSRLRKSKRVHRRRARRAHFGELVQMDGSFHAWLEDRGPVACLLTMIDDATGTTLGHFTGEETTWGAAEMLQAWIAMYGVPRALYVDAKSVFVRPATGQELAAGIPPLTQFGRMCATLDIVMIVATSPEAKGRVERVHGTNQDRLVKKLRRAGIATYADANAYVAATYWPAHNTRFAVAPAEAADFHLPVPPRLDLAHVFCLETPRVVGNDWVVRYGNRALQIVPTARAKRLTHPRGRIVVHEMRTGALFVVARAIDGTMHCLDWHPITAATHQPSYQAPTPLRPPKPAPPPAAGYTLAGRPLSTRQMAARARWNHAIAVHITRKAARTTARTTTAVTTTK